MKLRDFVNLKSMKKMIKDKQKSIKTDKRLLYKQKDKSAMSIPKKQIKKMLSFKQNKKEERMKIAKEK